MRKDNMQLPWSMPVEIKDAVMSWAKATKSPYSQSYYNLAPGEKDWGKTPIGSLRASDHWNFVAKQSRHCHTLVRPVPPRTWSIGQWNGDCYVILMSIPFVKLYNITESEIRTLPKNVLRAYEKVINKRRKMYHAST